MKRLERYFRWSPRGALGTIADLLAILTTIVAGFTFFTDRDYPKTVLALTICGLALAFIYISFRLQRLLEKSTSAAERHVRTVAALPYLSTAAAHATRATLAARNKGEFELHLARACQDLASMYSLATGSPCRVTVMQIWSPTSQGRRPGDAPGKELAVKLTAASYDERGDREGIDWLRDNSDFEKIFLRGEPYFLCNDLPDEVSRGYKNSHWEQEDIEKFKKEDSWPYKSALVLPIVSKPTNPAGGLVDLAGALCIDSKRLGTFDKDFDVPTGETFAHAMYSGLATYRGHPPKPESGRT